MLLVYGNSTHGHILFIFEILGLNLLSPDVELLEKQTKDILRELAKHGYQKLSKGLIGKHM